MINLVFSSDAAGFSKSATVVASIIRRTKEPVHVRYWCTGFLPDDIAVDRLKVEFFEVEEEPDGNYPGHVPPAVFNRLRVIKDCPDWDRCLVMDHDMAVFCDMAEYFREDFEGKLLMGRLFGEGNTLGLQMEQRGGLPENWKHAESCPYFFMGPMMNLAAMRESGTWEKLVKAHKEIGQDEQLSLTAACGGSVKGVDKKWNLVPQWDHLAASAEHISGAGLEEHSGLTWSNGVPLGLIHWSEWAKPWHYQSQVWRADLWDGERTLWEQLRYGQWDKPLAILVRCDDPHEVKGLLNRGWRVLLCDNQCLGGSLREVCSPHPDLQLTSFAEITPELIKSSASLKIYGDDDLTNEISPHVQQIMQSKHIERVDYVNFIEVLPVSGSGTNIFLDIGSQRGLGLKEFVGKLNLDDKWKIHCFEPNPAYADCPPSVDELQEVAYWPVAVWTDVGQLPLKRGGHPPDQGIDGWGSTLLLHSDVPSVDQVIVPTIDFVEWLRANTDENDHVYIKMDIEGAEYAVLRKMLDAHTEEDLFTRIKLLAVEFHDRLLPGENEKSTAELIDKIRPLSQLRLHH